MFLKNPIFISEMCRRTFTSIWNRLPISMALLTILWLLRSAPFGDPVVPFRKKIKQVDCIIFKNRCTTIKSIQLSPRMASISYLLISLPYMKPGILLLYSQLATTGSYPERDTCSLYIYNPFISNNCWYYTSSNI